MLPNDIERRRDEAHKAFTKARSWLQFGDFKRALRETTHAANVIRTLAEEVAKTCETSTCGIHD